ncbi:MAG: ABC transporter ATP-binding protein [Actinopolymorphaceae bacterium]
MVPRARVRLGEALRRWLHGVRSVALAVKLLWSAKPTLVIVSFALQAVSGLGLGAALLLANHVVGLLLANAGSGGPGLELIPYVGILVVVAACIAFAGSAQMGTRKLLVEHAVRHVQGLLLTAAAAVDLEEFERADFHGRLQRARTHAIMAPMGVADAVFGLSMALVTMVGVGVALLLLAPVALPIVLAGALPLWILGARRGSAMYQFTFGQSPHDQLRQALEDTVLTRASVKEVHAFGLFDFLKRRWDTLYDERIHGETWLVKRSLTRLSLGAGISALALGCTLVVLAVLVANGDLAVASGLTAAVSVQVLSSRLTSAGVSLEAIFENSLHLQDFAELTSLSQTENRCHGGDPPGPFRSVSLESVSFSYPDTSRNVLDSVDFALQAGEVVALVGENGSGKTTLAKLVSGLYRPTSGVIRWSGRDMSELDLNLVRPQVAPIFQDFVRYPLPAGQNISVGDTRRVDDHQAIRRAADKAGATNPLARLPEGFDTLLMKELPDGADLSGGEWQKVALARAFFRDAPLIVLDEPTAALDATAEHEIFTRMRFLAHGRAVLLISHRFSTVRGADRIVVIHRGRIVEEGTHDQLMLARGRYQRMFTLQAAPYAAGDTNNTVSTSGSGSPPP